MHDDDIFEHSMASLGVEPLDERGAGAEESPPDRLEDEDLRRFEQAMRDLDSEGREGGAAPRRALPKPRRLKTRPKHLRIDEQLDLHGLKSDEAERRLGSFVARSAGSGSRTVLVITGKGHHSPGGRGVLRQRVEEWIRRRGRGRVRAWSEAPARLGGRGAFVLYLRQPD